MNPSGISLWRGERLLGAIHLRRPRTNDFITGVLIPSADAGALESLRQTRVHMLPGEPVLQQAVQPIIMGERPSKADSEESADGWVAFPVTQGEAQRVPGVEPDAQLSIREEWGDILPLDVISLTEVRLVPGEELRTISDFPEEVVRNGSVWMVSGHAITAR